MLATLESQQDVVEYLKEEFSKDEYAVFVERYLHPYGNSFDILKSVFGEEMDTKEAYAMYDRVEELLQEINVLDDRGNFVFSEARLSGDESDELIEEPQEGVADETDEDRESEHLEDLGVDELWNRFIEAENPLAAGLLKGPLREAIQNEIDGGASGPRAKQLKGMLKDLKK